jgi:hypothetical protein
MAEKRFALIIASSKNNKVITDFTFSKSSSLSLPLLPPSNEEQSHGFQRSTTANHAHIAKAREEYTFIRSEIDNEEQDN